LWRMIGMTEMVGWFEAKVDGCCFLKTPCGVRDESLWGLGWCIMYINITIKYIYIYISESGRGG